MAVAGALDGGRHACCLFATDADRMAMAAHFLAVGISRHQALLYLADTTSADTLVGFLDGLGLDGSSRVRSGQLQVRSTDESYLAAGAFEPGRVVDDLRARIDEALDAGYAALRVTGEMTWARRGAPGSERLAEYEEAVAPLFDDGSLVALCQYDRRAFDDDATAAVVGHHDVCASATAGGGFAAARRHDGVRLTGDVDFTDVAVLEAWLEATAVATGGDIELDLASVEFLDIAAMRVLASVAAGLPDGGCLRLRNLPPMARRVLALTGWDATPGLALA